jgi:hypothetical protein
MRGADDHDHPEFKLEAAGGLPGEEHPDWSVLAAPLEPAALDALIDGALAQRARAEAKPLSFLRRHRWLPLAVGGALAAGVLLVLRPEPPLDAFELDVRPGRTQTRGEAPRTDADVYDLRNEPQWKIHASERTDTDGLAVYLVAQTVSGMTLLQPRIEPSGQTFRVLGELGDLGLRPGAVTVHFVLGPAGRADEVLSHVQAHTDGTELPAGWRVQSRDMHFAAW